MRNMGGLKRSMPVTFWTMTIAVLAIAGFPPLAAFFSKDAILAAAFMQEGGLGKVLWFVGLVTALLSSFYMFRLWYLTFLGERRSAHSIDEHGAAVHARHDARLTQEAGHAHEPHESPGSMLGPLVILAVLSVIGGWVGAGRFGAYLAPSVGARTAEAASNTVEIALTVLAVLAALLGWFIAHRMYRVRPGSAERLATSMAGPYNVLVHKYWIDELYHAVIV
jgi:NADH-quinone oxidoreductase subunit L